jgi:1,2-diacylglycerol 3-beta-galactosyltransferase
MKRIDFLFFDAGGGHRAAANALHEVIKRQGSPFDVRIVNLQEVLDSVDVIRKLTGLRSQDLYNLLLKKGWTLGSGQMARGMHVILRIFHRQSVKALEKHWRESRPDMVVSLVPNLNRAIYFSLRRTLPGVPMVVILTDLADYPPHFWMERQLNHVICPTEKAVQQARALSYAEDYIHRVSGVILNPAFYDAKPLTPDERAAALKELGLDPQKPVGLVLFGGQGASVMLSIARRLPDRQLILICGHNAKLRAALQALPHPAPIFVEGFTKNIPHYMQLANYLIGKPGPGSVSEAVAMHLPVIVVRNAFTLPQERYNADWIRENSLGIVLKSFRNIAPAVDSLLEPGILTGYQAATQRMQNRAVFEIPEILDEILSRTPEQIQDPVLT